eukprot:scaffold287_cov337-Pavlova_lutheri.AAC.205
MGEPTLVTSPSSRWTTPSKASGRTPRSKTQGDRFIPNRSAMDVDMAQFNLMKENAACPEDNPVEVRSPSKEEYKKRLAVGLMGENGSAEGAKILAFKNKAPPPPAGYDNPMRALYSANTSTGPGNARKKQFRQIPQAPERILDAPEILDDYYLNLLDWNCKNVLAVALSSTVYLWNAESGDIQQLCQMSDEDDYISSVQWAPDGKHISVGTSTNEVQIWDAERVRQIRSLRGHAARVSSLAWNGPLLCSGGRDSVIMQHDVRIREHVTATLRSHEQEVCGLKWSPNGQQLASGGNDNLLHIWDANSMSSGTHVHRITGHQAAVKALAWCPFQSNLLASGGGTADRCIKFWNTYTGAMLNSIDTHSQVCSLQWNPHEREILSSHGFSQNQLCLWKYPSMVKMAEMTGHTSRVLHLAMNPDGTTIVSAAADETLRFWKAFAAPEIASKEKPSGNNSTSMLRSINIR